MTVSSTSGAISEWAGDDGYIGVVRLRCFVLVLPLAAIPVMFAACGEDAPSPSTTETASPDGSDTITEAGSSVDNAGNGPTLAVTLGRDDPDGGSSRIRLHVTALLADGGGVSAESLEVKAGSASVSALVAVGVGQFEATVTPAEPSGELPITVTAKVSSATLTSTVTALALPTVAPLWGQPEAVPGLVNTDGYEDGVVISPDGEWLFVGSYSPVDMICCALGCGGAPNPFSTACQTALGPYGAPARPGMFGAERIVSPTRILNRCDKLCLTAPDGGEVDQFALPPVASYGFHRMADGTFAEPFLIGRDADGCAAPFGISLLAPPQGTAAEMVFGARPISPPGPDNDLYYAPLTLGAPNVLARYSCEGGAIVESASTMTRLALTPTLGEQGNPQLRGGFLMFDDDNVQGALPKMYVAKVTGALPGGAISPTSEMPVGAATDDRRQPYLHGSTLYYAKNLSIATAELSGDPASAASWSDPRVALAGEVGSTRTGAIVSLGQPTVADRSKDGSVELYFVYGVKTRTGLNLQAGRVRRR